jgi:hypothetical protein
MQLSNFGLKFSELRTADIDQVPSGNFTLFAHGVPWYNVQRMSFGLVVTRSPAMASLMFTGAHPMPVVSQSVAKLIVDSKATSGEATIKLLRKAVDQRMSSVENAELLAAIDHWLGQVELQSVGPA